MPTKRLEYIDAMRGFTMLLVVFSHVIVFGYHCIDSTFNTAFVQFRMPLFFFISGFVLYKAERVWNLSASLSFLKNKFVVQIVPTVFFLIIYDILFEMPVLDSFFNSAKNGYWFTVALFEFFLIYVAINNGFGKWRKLYLGVSFLLLMASQLSTTSVVVSPLYKISPAGFDLPSLLGVVQWRYLVFLYLGTFVKKHFDRFCRLTDNGNLMALAIAAFFFLVFVGKSNFYREVYAANIHVFMVIEIIRKFITGTLGIMVVFAFFRKKEALFTKDTWLGRSLQYVGRRTLDVYLLHYFFLPRNLTCIGTFFNKNVNPSIEFFVTLAIAILVVALSLCMSSILHLSPLLEHYLFGVKKKQTT